MLEERARPPSFPVSSAATTPRPPSVLQQSMAEGEEDNEDERDMPDQEQSSIQTALPLSQLVLPTCMVDKLPLHGYPTGLISSQQHLDDHCGNRTDHEQISTPRQLSAARSAGKTGTYLGTAADRFLCCRAAPLQVHPRGQGAQYKETMLASDTGNPSSCKHPSSSTWPWPAR